MGKIMITGGCGFIGLNLLPALKDHQVYLYDLKAPLITKPGVGVVSIPGDVRDYHQTLAYMEGMDVVIHLAALPRVQHCEAEPGETAKTNVTGTLNVCEAARRCKVKKIIFASSGAVYGNNAHYCREDHAPQPDSSYAMQKLVGESIIQQSGIPSTIFRMFNVYGPGMSSEEGYALAVPKFIQAYHERKPFPIYGAGTSQRDYVHVQDIAKAFADAVESETRGIYNLGTGIGTTVLELAEMISGVVKPECVHSPAVTEPRRLVAYLGHTIGYLGWYPQIPLEPGLIALRDGRAIPADPLLDNPDTSRAADPDTA